MDNLRFCFAVFCLFLHAENASSWMYRNDSHPVRRGLEEQNDVEKDSNVNQIGTARQTRDHDGTPCNHRNIFECWSCTNVPAETPEQCQLSSYGQWQTCTGSQVFCATLIKQQIGAEGDAKYYIARNCSDTCTEDCKSSGVYPCTTSCDYDDITYANPSYRCTDRGLTWNRDMVDAKRQEEAPIVESATQCDKYIRSERGFIQSPNYPNNYPNDVKCNFTVDVGNRIIDATFIDFNIEYQSRCAFDSVQVSEVTGNSNRDVVGRKLCGKLDVLPKTSFSAYYKMELIFETDFNYNEKGFKLEYETSPYTIGQCLFGSGPHCAFPCHCFIDNDSGCDPTTGGCPDSKCAYKQSSNSSIEVSWMTVPNTDLPCQYGNVALGKVASQIGSGENIADKGVDGLLGLSVYVYAPDTNTNAWWSVDLGSKHKISRVFIYNIKLNNGNVSTLGNFDLKHGNLSNVYLHWGCNNYDKIAPLGEVINMSCPIVAKFVSIMKIANPLKNHLQFDEVMVLGHKFYDVDCDACSSGCRPNLYCQTCESSLASPECILEVRKNCLNPPSVVHGTVNYNLTIVGSKATVICDAGYTLYGDATVVCGLQGEWGKLPMCNKTTCGQAPASPEGGNAVVEGFMYGDIVKYGCKDGYVIDPTYQGMVMCAKNGSWVGEIPHCKKVNCGSIPTVEHGKINATNSLYQSTGVLICDIGYTSNGGYFICNAKGSWESMGSVKPSCSEQKCNDAPAPGSHGNVAYDPSSNTVAVYTCTEGYQLEGVSQTEYQIQCTTGGKWSADPPFCEQKCGGMLMAGKGSIASPQYPEPYNNDRDCVWLIYADNPGKSIELTFLDFDIEDNCDYDSLHIKEIFGGRHAEIGKFCGKTKPENIISMGQAIALHFSSDQAKTAKGFDVKYVGIVPDPQFSMSQLLSKFYAELSSTDIHGADITTLSEVYVTLRGRILADENMFEHADCLYIYESVGCVAYFALVPAYRKADRYLVDLIDHMLIHSPFTDENTERIFQLLQNGNFSAVWMHLFDPMMDLARNVTHLFGLELEEYPPAVEMFEILVEMLQSRSVEDPAEKVIISLAEEANRLLLEALNKTGTSYMCDAEIITKSVEMFMETAANSMYNALRDLPTAVATIFGEGSEKLVEIFLYELEEHFDMLARPYELIAELLDALKVSKTYGTKNDAMDIPGKPKNSNILQFTVAQLLKNAREYYVQSNVVKYLLETTQVDSNIPLYDISVQQLTSLLHNMWTYLQKEFSDQCMEVKMVAMVSGLMEVKLFDIVMVNLDISKVAKEAGSIVTSYAPDVDTYEIYHDFRSKIFSFFRKMFLQFDLKLQEITGGQLKAETLPLDLLLILSHTYSTTFPEVVYDVVDVTLPLMKENVTCKQIDIAASVGVEIDKFLLSFQEAQLSIEMDNLMNSFSFVNNVSDSVKDAAKEVLKNGTKKILDKLLNDIMALKWSGDNTLDKSHLMDYVTNGTAKILYNLLQLNKPNPDVDVDVEKLVAVIELQHSTLQKILTHYVETLKKLLQTTGDGEIKICDIYPQICQLELKLSLSMDNST